MCLELEATGTAQARNLPIVDEGHLIGSQVGDAPAGTIRERMTVIGKAMFDFLSRPEMIQFERRIAAEQFVSMCKGMGDLERRFGSVPSKEANENRVAGAVDVFLKAYGVNRAK